MYGEEKYLIKEYNKKLIDKYLNEGYKEFNLITIDGSKFTYNKLHENLETLPFFDKFKIVILNNVDLTKSGISSKSNEFDLLSKYIENIPKSTIFIITMLYSINNIFFCVTLLFSQPYNRTIIINFVINII